MQLYLSQPKCYRHPDWRLLEHLNYIFPALALLLFPPELNFSGKLEQTQNKHNSYCKHECMLCLREKECTSLGPEFYNNPEFLRGFIDSLQELGTVRSRLAREAGLPEKPLWVAWWKWAQIWPRDESLRIAFCIHVAFFFIYNKSMWSEYKLFSAFMSS